MLELEALICQQCGGAIDRKTMRCPYCDTQYKRNNDGVEINYVVTRPGVHTIRAMVAVDNMLTFHNPDKAAKFAIDKMHDQIARGLADYLKITTERDFYKRCQIIRGEIRVVDPTFSEY